MKIREEGSGSDEAIVVRCQIRTVIWTTIEGLDREASLVNILLSCSPVCWVKRSTTLHAPEEQDQGTKVVTVKESQSKKEESIDSRT